jgi:D-lactate dehydrogenase
LRETQGSTDNGVVRPYDITEFILDQLAPRLRFRKLPRTVGLHIPCSLRKMELHSRLTSLASLCAERVMAPDAIPCCGFAGDRGFAYPELPASALVTLRGLVGATCDAGYSTSRTCEIGVSQHSGLVYQSIAYLVDEATEPV